MDPDELAEVIVEDILTEELKERTVSVWLWNSFVDPSRGIDENETDSDLDVFVLVPDWELPVMDSGLPIVAPRANVPEVYEQNVQGTDWTSKDGKWRSAERAWERIPEHVQKTLLRCLEHGFFASESDVESNTIRLYDLTIVNQYQFEYGDNDPKICIRENDDL